ncbi:S26 family signal peptidase [Natronocalculus amylovorans]|uniref:S26 family signal peptidase n=1 Tax=Natronocalculus amylovorans TaxID=2917812 RepID=A0AAE3FVM9_9EURY|nr:S26 family signal peptidase [Natronocalculus amylovorans]MCL9816061.1 S26 family signal peptidase [Natronocalculus amylovorans]
MSSGDEPAPEDERDVPAEDDQHKSPSEMETPPTGTEVGNDTETETGVNASTDPDPDSNSNSIDDAVTTQTEPITSSSGDHAEEDQRSTSVDPRADHGFFYRFYHANDGPLMFIREILLSALIVLLIGGLLFGLSGVWPPMVAIESESMEPNIQIYDLVFVTAPDRFSPSDADEYGVVTLEHGEDVGYESFNKPGSVVVFDEPGTIGPPIIHRPHLYVEEGEDWSDRADPDASGDRSCSEMSACPAPTDGYITKGDNNGRYDQVSGIAPVVEEDWITGVARFRIPYLGWIRLAFTGQAVLTPTIPLFGIAAVGSTVLGRKT